MLSDIFVIGDVHGEIRQLEKLLEKWDAKKQQLIFIGDLGDRGENPKECFLLVQQLVEQQKAICLRGNHEEMLLLFLRQPDLYAANYAMNGGYKTLETLLGKEAITSSSPQELSRLVRSQYRSLVAFVESTPLYWETDEYIFVHAGVNLHLPDWHDTDPEDFIWIREPFHRGKNQTGKTIVFGHTPTFHLHQERDNSNIWQQDGKIGIDGGAVYGGTLHGLVFSREGIQHHYGVRKQKNGSVFLEEYQEANKESQAERGWKKAIWKPYKKDKGNE